MPRWLVGSTLAGILRSTRQVRSHLGYLLAGPVDELECCTPVVGGPFQGLPRRCQN